LNFVIRDGDVISDTPGFWGSNPATVKVFVHGGPSVGTRNLADEEQLALICFMPWTEINEELPSSRKRHRPITGLRAYPNRRPLPLRG
jgi:hypothetical protein